MKLFSKGGADEVTGSRHYLNTGDSIIQIDCGAFQGRRKESDEKNRAIEMEMLHPSAVVLTHAHFDHCGMLPLLSKAGYNGNIYTTPATRDLATLIMMDSANIQARDLEHLTYLAEKKGKVFKEEPLYTEDDVVKTGDLFVTVSYRRPLPITPDVEMTFYDAGHILGSAGAHLTVNKGRDDQKTIYFSGDLGRNNRAIIRDPEEIPTPDYMVMESTYGNRLHEDIHDAMEKLAEVVSSTAKNNGKVIIPSFAIERTQEIIYYLHLLVDQGKIPKIPIFVDSPMATNATSIFRVHPECYDKKTQETFTNHHENPFGFNELKYTSSVQDSKEINNVKGPAIIISADGMCEAGRIRHHLVQNIRSPKNTILIVGYMAGHTLGRRIMERQKQVRIFGDVFNLKARVEKINAFSAHADYSEIAAYIGRLDLNKLKTVYLVHGETDARANLKKVLLETGVQNVEIVTPGREYEI
ncbi:MAG: MBL fold metallo-hydrolase [Spirochaetales bacterium]|nr:MBL fold metallo-hydrolase [Spirochaetales bacterium]